MARLVDAVPLILYFVNSHYRWITVRSMPWLRSAASAFSRQAYFTDSTRYGHYSIIVLSNECSLIQAFIKTVKSCGPSGASTLCIIHILSAWRFRILLSSQIRFDCELRCWIFDSFSVSYFFSTFVSRPRSPAIKCPKWSAASKQVNWTLLYCDHFSLAIGFGVI